MQNKGQRSKRTKQVPASGPRTGTTKSRTPGSVAPRAVAQTVNFKELMLHQVVSFSTRFVQYVVAVYVSQHRITLPELRALFLLGRYGNLAPIRIAELATTDRATATRAINSLRRRNLVRVRADPGHHKRTVASLTPAGVEMHDRLAKLVNFRNEWLKGHFAPDELRTLFALLRRLEALAQSRPTQLPGDDVHAGVAGRQQTSPPTAKLDRAGLGTEMGSRCRIAPIGRVGERVGRRRRT